MVRLEFLNFEFLVSRIHAHKYLMPHLKKPKERYLVEMFYFFLIAKHLRKWLSVLEGKCLSKRFSEKKNLSMFPS